MFALSLPSATCRRAVARMPLRTLHNYPGRARASSLSPAMTSTMRSAATAAYADPSETTPKLILPATSSSSSSAGADAPLHSLDFVHLPGVVFPGQAVAVVVSAPAVARWLLRSAAASSAPSSRFSHLTSTGNHGAQPQLLRHPSSSDTATTATAAASRFEFGYAAGLPKPTVGDLPTLGSAAVTASLAAAAAATDVATAIRDIQATDIDVADAPADVADADAAVEGELTPVWLSAFQPAPSTQQQQQPASSSSAQPNGASLGICVASVLPNDPTLARQTVKVLLDNLGRVQAPDVGCQMQLESVEPLQDGSVRVHARATHRIDIDSRRMTDAGVWRCGVHQMEDAAFESADESAHALAVAQSICARLLSRVQSMPAGNAAVDAYLPAWRQALQFSEMTLTDLQTRGPTPVAASLHATLSTLSFYFAWITSATCELSPYRQQQLLNTRVIRERLLLVSSALAQAL
ncbi:hypothetical protein CAOG_01018 [Capsaspora owczarzaki ATCC 30864]|uniref:Lon N-terminal domain-containing protein n=1 Tax=Capsaspora owczarzaki (strain ATCC 30864) TaxID=595528 RepID=A0A0D2WIC9_CAPO3|nr:hypothetical protein CAOG_01018 [Capsaspora owczarzaki ATCC 30864]KJE89575.1 hypothetical protein CAOG_001018 [Capsaspora owczarzaki ATCC 30864]|eukprot:XP_004365889.2 hypothetical protein CAOG_01018 [Capsaspora owczarzaki ATCC 30864]